MKSQSQLRYKGSFPKLIHMKEESNLVQLTTFDK